VFERIYDDKFGEMKKKKKYSTLDEARRFA